MPRFAGLAARWAKLYRGARTYAGYEARSGRQSVQKPAMLAEGRSEGIHRVHKSAFSPVVGPGKLAAGLTLLTGDP
jgi:hypothetical protein